MGILIKGLFGGFVNKTGPLVGRVVKGKNLITGLSVIGNKSRSLIQSQQQNKIILTINALVPIKSLIASGFKRLATKRSAFSEAVKYNYANALICEEGVYRIDFSLLLYSKGCLEGIYDMQMALIGDSVAYTWLLTRNGCYTDLVTFLVYSEDKQLAIAANDVVSRSTGEFSFQLPPSFLQDRLHCYISLKSLDWKTVSNSIYLGTFNK